MTTCTDLSSTALVVYTPPQNLREKIVSYNQKVSRLVTQHSFRMQFADYHHFHRNWMGNIIVLSGTSTAGKTSIIKALRQLEPERIEDGIDLRCDMRVLQDFRKRCPQEMAVLETVIELLNIPRAVLSKERFWKAGVSAIQKEEAEKCMQRIKEVINTLSKEDEIALFEHLEPEMFNAAFERAHRGERLILDAIQIDALFECASFRKFDGPMTVVLVYCPFRALSSRMEKRNQEAQANGNFGNQRIGTFPLEQFSEIYTHKNPEQRTLEVVTLNQARRAFDENFDKEIALARIEGRTAAEERQVIANREQSLQRFLYKLGFENDINQVEIAPRQSQLYHLLLNSQKLSAKQSAKILSDFIS